MTPVKPRPVGASGSRHRVACTSETPPRPTALPSQRAGRHVVLPPPAPPTSWEGYSNAGPDCYWSPEGDRLSLS
jgi:hypothetical protein